MMESPLRPLFAVAVWPKGLVAVTGPWSPAEFELAILILYVGTLGTPSRRNPYAACHGQLACLSRPGFCSVLSLFLPLLLRTRLTAQTLAISASTLVDLTTRTRDFTLKRRSP